LPRAPAPGSGRVTLRTVADHLGLSVTTVSRALKHGADVNAATIATVEAAARSLGYRPHLGGINLRTGRTHAIGVILPLERPGEVSNVVASLIEGIAAHLRSTAYRTTVVPLFRDDDPLKELADLVLSRTVDGVILTNTRPDDDRVAYLLEVGLPFATFGRTNSAAHPFVDIDHQRIGHDAAERLTLAGHADPVLIAPPRDLSYSRQFLDGWHQFRSQKTGARPDRILHAAGSPEGGRQAASELLQLYPDATAAFIASEEGALGFVSGLVAQGRQVGRDFAAITYGGSQLHSFLNPPLSAFLYPHFDIGERLARFLVQSIEGEAAASLQAVVEAKFVDLGSERFG
jgi:LacI family transcriptional regulator